MNITPIAGFNSNVITMSSLEISSLVESNHADVRRSIERLGNRGVITLPPLAEVSNDGPGPKTISVYNLCKRDSLIVVAQLCPEFTARIIDRWQELEAQTAKPPAVRDPRTQALIESLVRFDALEQEQLRLRDEQDELRRQTQEVATRLNQIETAQNHFTIVGYATATGHNSVALRHAASLGRSATRYCKDNNIEMGEVPDPRFGRVKTYPQWVLDIIFAEDVSVT